MEKEELAKEEFKILELFSTVKKKRYCLQTNVFLKTSVLSEFGCTTSDMTMKIDTII